MSKIVDMMCEDEMCDDEGDQTVPFLLLLKNIDKVLEFCKYQKSFELEDSKLRPTGAPLETPMRDPSNLPI